MNASASATMPDGFPDRMAPALPTHIDEKVDAAVIRIEATIYETSERRRLVRSGMPKDRLRLQQQGGEPEYRFAAHLCYVETH
jgi:hypothetical protein